MAGSVSLPVGVFVERAQDVLDELQQNLEHRYGQGIRDGHRALMLLATVNVIGSSTIPGFDDWHRQFVHYVRSHPESVPLNPQDIQHLGDTLRPLHPRP